MIKTIVDKLLDTMITILLGAMALLISVNVFCRFVLNFSIHWADELAMILFVWLTFLGAAIAIRDKSHYVLNFITPKLQGNGRKNLVAFQNGLMIVITLVLFITGSIVTWKIRNWLMPATEISRSFVYGACPVGCLFMLYYFLLDLRSKKIDQQTSHI